ncbi:MAG: hypothetical protein U0Y68_25420 [Blastocatellia bacterium]
MKIAKTVLSCLFVLGLVLTVPQAQSSLWRLSVRSTNHRIYTGALWQAPSDITNRNLFYGAGGATHQPGQRFRFVKEEKGGSNPKFEIEDETGVRWKVKLGPEAQSETAATRLLWAVGYFTDEDYYLPRLQVEGLKKLGRGQSYVQADGSITGARLERVFENTQSNSWSWFDNPFVRSREFNGLKVMMALLNNWDLKEENNKIEMRNGQDTRYVVSDLGATFGKTGDHLVRTRNNVPDYLASKFIDKVKPEEVDFVLHSRPHPILIFNLPYYLARTKMESLVNHIPRPDAQWIGSLLARLSDAQLNDAFRAAGYPPGDVQLLTSKVKARIHELNRLEP